MPVAYVNGTSRHNAGATTGNSISTTYGFNTVAANSGAIGIFYKGSGTLSTVQDSLGNNYNLDCGTGPRDRMGNGTLNLVGCSNLIAGTNPTITATFSGAQSEVDIYPVMYSGCDNADMWDTANAATGTGTASPLTSAAFTTSVADGAVVAFGVTNDTNGSAGLIGGVAATARLAPVGWATVLEDRIYSGSLGSITAGIVMSGGFTLGRILVGILKPGSSLTKKVRIPTALADGTQRVLVAFTDATLATKLATPQLVTASGGFFKLTAASAVVGTKYPAVLWSFGADQTVDARGGPCWATGIEE